MKWSESPFGEKISLAEVMISGIKDHQTELTVRGIDDAFTTNLETQLQTAITSNNTQEKLKGDLKEATQLLNDEIEKLGKLYMEAKKTIKIIFPQEVWKKFGMDDKK